MEQAGTRGDEGTVPAAVGRRASPPGRPPGPALSRVLRGLGLLTAAAFLMCAAASQAQAQVLVGNAAQGYAGRVAGGRALDLAQGFTTGNDSAGYTLSAIALRFANASPVAAPTVTVHSRTPTGPAVATLSGPGEVGAGMATFRAPASTTLTAATAYFVRVEGGGRVELALTWGREDAGAASGWRIHDRRHYRFAHSTGSFDTAESVHAMTVSGASKGGEPVEPTDLGATVTTAEDEAYAFRAGDFGFSGAASDDTLASVRIVTLPDAGRLTLLALPVSAGDRVTWADIDAGRLAFTPAANANGDGYASFTFKVIDGSGGSETAHTMTVNVTAVADAATGSPSIWGTAKVGHELTASTGGIRDADGLPSTFTYRWIRVDGTSESNITDATSSSYTLVAADQGKTVKVKVGFTDSGGSAESLTSDATDTVEAAVTEVCNAPDFGTRRPIWKATLTVEDYLGAGIFVGYDSITPPGYGALDNPTFTIGGSSYIIKSLDIVGPNYPVGVGDMVLKLDTDLAPRHQAALAFHVCDTSLALSGVDPRAAGDEYEWDTSFNWSSVTKRTLWLSVPTRVPTAKDSRVTVDIGGLYTFRAADFNFTGADPADSLASVVIETYPAAGQLDVNDTLLSAIPGEVAVTRAELDAGRLKFEAASGTREGLIKSRVP